MRSAGFEFSVICRARRETTTESPISALSGIDTPETVNRVEASEEALGRLPNRARLDRRVSGSQKEQRFP